VDYPLGGDSNASMTVDTLVWRVYRQLSMYFFAVLGYGWVVATRTARVVDPIACCSPVRRDALDEEQSIALAQSFAALSDPIRLRLLSFITSADDEVCACDLVEPSGRSQPTVSHHMKILVDAGLVSRDKRGLWVWYRLIPGRLDALRAVLGK
jgi:ArsR family transcriptional regulator, arsenate/arsenite/antimonite-responsive transcriptional repressor